MNTTNDHPSRKSPRASAVRWNARPKTQFHVVTDNELAAIRELIRDRCYHDALNRIDAIRKRAPLQTVETDRPER